MGLWRSLLTICAPLPLQLEGVDRVAAAANAVGYALEDAAKRITSHARIARRVSDIIAITDQERKPSSSSAHRLSGALQRPRIPGPLGLCE